MMQEYKYDKDSLKESLTLEQVFDLVAELGGEPRIIDNYFISRTICHNSIGAGSHKLYYYDNTKLFRCYTDCGEVFDIYELVRKVKNIAGETKSYMTKEGLTVREWLLPDAIEYVASYYGFSPKTFDFESLQNNLQDWQILNNYERISSIREDKQIVELKVFDDTVLKNLPTPIIAPWEEEGIKREVIAARGICYDPAMHGVVIPHYDENGNLIGIRERTLIKENEKYGKYRPAILNGKMYNHPLGFNLYNLNNSKDNIRKMRKAVVFESEKSCLKYASLFGIDNDISVAVCGSSLIQYQVKLLLECGVEEIIVAFDREGAEDDKSKYVKKFYDMQKKYGNVVKLTFMYDKKGELLNFKDSPIDKGKDIFLKLFKSRISL